MEKEVSLSVVVLNYQGLGIIEDCLRAVLNNSLQDYEIILVDNASTDGSFERASLILANVKNKIIIRNGSNVGFVSGFNQGMEASQGKYILLLNNDAFVLPDALDKCVEFMDNNSRVGLAEGRIINKERNGYTTSDPNVVCTFGFFTEAGPHLVDPTPLSKEKLILSPVGVWPIYRKSVYKVVGGYDPDFVHVDEIRDLSMRVWISGFEVGYIFDAVAQHVGRLNRVSQNYGNSIALSSYFNATKNQAILFLKDFQFATIIRYIAFFCILKTVDLLYTLISLGKLAFVTKISAYLWVIKHLDSINIKRQAIQRYRKNKDSFILSHTTQLTGGILSNLVRSRMNFDRKTSKWMKPARDNLPTK